MIELSHALGKRVVAEGVETRQQLEFLREQGCDEAQGFLLSPPVEAGEGDALGGAVGVRGPAGPRHQAPETRRLNVLPART